MEENNYKLHDIDRDNDAVNERHLRDTKPLREKSRGSAQGSGSGAPAATGGMEINNREEVRIEEQFKTGEESNSRPLREK